MICYLARHGKDDDTVRGGWSLSELTEDGKTQAKAMADEIVRRKDEYSIKKLYSSDLPRAVQTIMPISLALGLEIELRPEFRETNNGVFAGMPNDIADEKYPGLYWRTLEWDQRYPGGESPHQFFERIQTAWAQFSKMIAQDNHNVMLVTHNGVINAIFALIDGRVYSNKEQAIRIPHATMVPLMLRDGVWERCE